MPLTTSATSATSSPLVEHSLLRPVSPSVASALSFFPLDFSSLRTSFSFPTVPTMTDSSPSSQLDHAAVCSLDRACHLRRSVRFRCVPFILLFFSRKDELTFSSFFRNGCHLPLHDGALSSLPTQSVPAAHSPSSRSPTSSTRISCSPPPPSPPTLSCAVFSVLSSPSSDARCLTRSQTTTPSTGR